MCYYSRICVPENTKEQIKQDFEISFFVTGGWYALRDWNEVDFDPKFVLQQLHVKYGVTPFFKINVVPNPSSPGTSSIRVSPSGLGLPDRSYYYGTNDSPIEQAYIQFIRDVVISLSITKTDAERFGRNMFHYEKRIAEISPGLFELENPINTYHPIRLSELSITAPSLPLQDILTAMFPEASINSDTEIIITSPDYLMKISQIVATTDRAVMNSYMIWTLVREYLPYLSSKLTSPLEAFQTELLGRTEPMQRWEFCTNVVRKYMGLATETLLENKYAHSEADKKLVSDMFYNIKNVMQKRLTKYSTIRDLERHLNRKMKSLKLQIGLPEYVKTEEFLKHYYSKLTVFKADLFQSFSNGISYLKSVKETRLNHPQAQDYIIESIIANPYSVSYEPSSNTVIIPRAVISQPHFDRHFPKSILYGRLGVEISEAILSSILPYHSAWTDDSKLLSPFHMIVNESISSIRYARRCLQKHMINTNLASSDEVANLTSLATYKHLVSTHIAHEALVNAIAEDEHVHQPAFETYEDSALFFLTFAQTHCSLETKEQKQYDNLNHYILPRKSLLYVTWNQNPDFPAAFNCPHKEELQCQNLY